MAEVEGLLLDWAHWSEICCGICVTRAMFIHRWRGTQSLCTVGENVMAWAEILFNSCYFPSSLSEARDIIVAESRGQY